MPEIILRNLQNHFKGLLSAIEPSDSRRALVASQAGNVREFLQAYAFETATPHTRLSGSYGRQTAIGAIRDVDVLVFVPQDARDQLPNAVLAELRRTLETYPNASVEVAGQRRSVRLTLLDHEIDLDLVPAFAAGKWDDMLEVPDRPKQEWIRSNPLGYAGRLSDLN
ncbi:MAG: hypothetical protein U0994_12610, partial [Gemmatimonadales bacterium]|nr:hypothetical protein [Gemmatimonadales bacterium]